MAHAELETTRSLLSDLIGFPTVSSDPNLALIDYCAERLADTGARLQVTRDESGAKANLFATIGPDIDGGVVLSGHTDVVPVEGQPWTSDPFGARDDGETIVGRGACDMKGFVAAALAMAPRFASRELTRPLHLAFTHDEEVGCLGAGRMLDALVKTGRRPKVCIIGEPTEMRIIEGHKGGHEYTTEFTGLEGHASLPDRGVNAIEYAARFIGKLLETQEALKARAPAESRFDPPYSTLQTGVVQGGIARNVIPRHCAIDWEIRPVSRADADFAMNTIRRYANEELLPRMRNVSPEASILTHVIGEIPGLEPMTDSEAVALAKALTGENASEVVSFGTEAGLFQAVGIDTVVCGPGSIEQAHRPDEFVSLDQLDQCLGMIERLIPNLST
jgi:acetylornithine deacetylase